MKENILIVGIGGSIGKALETHFTKSNDYEMYGTSSRNECVSDNIFLLDLMNTDSINSFPNIAIHHLIIASGYEPKSNLQESSELHIINMFRIHVTGPLLFLKKIQTQLTDASSVTFFSSPAAWQGSYDPSYAAVKGAINSLVRTLAKDLAPKTRVNAFSPSLIESSTVFNGMTSDFKQKHIDKTLNKRLLTLDECVQAIEFILKSKHYTGQILHLNGGMIYG